MLICETCNKEYETGKFCIECGNPLKEKPQKNTCQKCGTIIKTTGKFCPDCDANLTSESTVPQNAELTAKYYTLRDLYRAEKYDDAFILAKELADFGDARGQNMLGILFKNGHGVEKNQNKAIEWYKKAAEQGLDKAQVNLGCIYLYGTGDIKQAVYWFKKAAEQNNDNAMFEYGLCCYEGWGIEQNYEEAAIWLKRAAEQNNQNAFFLLGKCYYYGTGIEKDYQKAIEFFEKVADRAGAQTLLGDCYYFGNGVAQDYRKAVEWYRKAAEEDDDYAQYSLGYCYKNGQGTSQDDRMANYWLKKAAENGNESAKKELETESNDGSNSVNVGLFDGNEKVEENGANTSYDFDEHEAREKAEKFGNDASEEDVENVKENIDKMNRGPIAKIWYKVTTLWKAFKSPKTPASLKAMIIGGLIYLVSPLDVIPDPIPFWGLTDDVSVISFVFSQFLRLTANTAIATAVVGAVIKLYRLQIKEIQKELLKRKLASCIIKNLEKGKDNYIVNVGLKNDNGQEVDELTYEAEEIDDEIYEGMTIYA